jgi:hypothetical protein
MAPTSHPKVDGEAESAAILDFLELAEALYGEVGYGSDIHVRGRYFDFQPENVWFPDGGDYSTPIRNPQSHFLDTSVQHLSLEREAFATGLLDRVWQSAGIALRRPAASGP